MVFTDAPYVHVEAFINGVWVDLPADNDDVDGGGRVSGTAGVTISRGRSAGAQRANPGQCDFTLFNRDGKYSNRNPRSPYFGLLPLNVPVRVKADPYESHVEMHAYNPGLAVFANDSATLDVTGDIEIRIEYERDHTLANSFPLITKYDISSTNRSWFLGINTVGRAEFYWSPDGTSASRRGIISTEPVPSGRITLRMQLDVDNGSGGITGRFYTSDRMDGTFTQLGSTLSPATTTSIFNSTARVVIGASHSGDIGIGNAASRHFRGKVFQARLYSNLTGTIAASGNFSNLEIGATSYSDGTTTWTIASPAFVGSDSIRFHGLIPRFPIESTAGGRDVRSPITAYGLTQSLSTGATELASAMYRYYSAVATSVGYWPCEDGSAATYVSTPTPLARPGLATLVEFAQESSLAGSLPLMTIGLGSKVTGRFPAYTHTGSWAFGFSVFVDVVPAADIPYLMSVTTSTGVTMKFTIGTTTYLSEVYNPDGTLNSSANTGYGAGAQPGNWITVVFECIQAGANFTWTVNWRALDPAIGYAGGNTATGLTLGRLTSWSLNGVPAASAVNTVAIGHVIGTKDIDTLLEEAHIRSFRAYAGETDTDRLVRLCREEGLTLRVRGTGPNNTQMGPQTPKLLLNLLDECADAGRGVLYERRDSLSLEYIPRQELSKYATTTINYIDGDLLDARTDDTLTPANVVTVTRENGASSTATIESGGNSVNVIGRFGDPQTLNLYEDDQTRDIAAWIARISSWDESRWLGLDFELAKPGIIDDLAGLQRYRALDLMHAILITNPPDWLPIREPEMFIEQYAEVLFRRSHQLMLTETSPARSYKVGSFIDGELRVGSTTSKLTAGINNSVTSFSVTITEPQATWEYSTNFYISVSNDKEKMLVTNITGTASPFTFTVTRGNPAFTHTANAIVRLWDQKALGYTFEGIY